MMPVTYVLETQVKPSASKKAFIWILCAYVCIAFYYSISLVPKTYKQQLTQSNFNNIQNYFKLESYSLPRHLFGLKGENDQISTDSDTFAKINFTEPSWIKNVIFVVVFIINGV